MTTATQQLPADPARRLADKILARTNNGQELIDLLHDISNGGYKANKNDRATAANYLFDRGYGKCPKNQPRTPSTEPERDPESAKSDNHTNHSSDTPQTPPPLTVTRVPSARHPDRRRPPRIPRPRPQRLS